MFHGLIVHRQTVLFGSIDDIDTFEVRGQRILTGLRPVWRPRWVQHIAGIAVAVVSVHMLRVIPRCRIKRGFFPILIRRAHVGTENAIT